MIIAPRLRSAFALLLCCFLPGCVPVGQSAARVNGVTIADARFPSEDIAKIAAPKVWRALRDLPCTGYVIFAGHCLEGQFRPAATIESYPDHSRDAQANIYAGNVRLSATTVGSNIPPAAKVYVWFYEKLALGERVAVVYSVQTDHLDPGVISPPKYFKVSEY